MKDIAALLLAAGQSRRMGAFKPLLPFGDRTVIQRCVANLRAAGVEEVIVVLGHRADEVRTHLNDSNVRFALNADTDSEMGVSIARGIEQVNADARAVLIALVDHPAVSPEAIASLIDEWRSGAKLVQPEQGGRGGHPVLIDLTYRNELLHLDPRRGLRSFFDAHRTEALRLPMESPYVARDMDTWEDYLALHREVLGWAPSAKQRFS